MPFHTVLIHGLVRDEQGRKMSKSLGNGVNPLEMIDLYGADALRYALMVGNAPGNDLRWREDKFENGRNFINKIWNAFRFIAMNFDDTQDFSQVKADDYSIEDRFIMSELRRTIVEVSDHLEELELGLALEKTYFFIWDLFCDWYIEMVKERLKENNASGRAAQYVLFRVFSDTMALLHPFMPFVTERIYQDLHEGEMLVTAMWPKPEDYQEDLEASAVMRHMIDAIRGVRNIRSEYKIAPQQRFSAKLRTEDAALSQRMTEAVETLTRLAGIATLERVPTDEALPSHDVVIVFTGGEIAIPLDELVDQKQEKQRLEKEADQLRAEISRAKGMLSNEQFTSKAPARVIEQQRSKKEQYEAQLVKVLEQIDNLARSFPD